MEFSRQEYWSGLPFSSPGDLPDPGVEPRSPALQQTLYRLSHQGSPVGTRAQPLPGTWSLPRARMEPCSLHWEADSIHSTTRGGGPLSLVGFSSEKDLSGMGQDPISDLLNKL
ncbi:unnamed protein product [Rangifer tarandus platyrhynchus]|uniref:Uncharacterized protein n=2 Tax=Rangifer tarandus platyrhynchus TaxID=3082113 RepID=A0AC59ZEV3_RANTA|nr:unnamed protein product [Rangifer tarandus platyrhynchus]